MRLKRIELQGFKSFADRTELRFDGHGIVAIVGPNGCGKSNLADAISWVLGEQSAKTLRGSRMEDVIFAGTPARKPLSMAQVTMTLSDPLGTLAVHEPGNANGKPVNGKAAAAREITITRRLFRSGESEYLIDGRPARLRDIQDIFLGTGLGPDSYAIIEQGRIGQILSSKPQDRRLVIEEAAGISRFKTRRRLAEAKLEAAKHNLERVFDILEEVGRQANSLKRQAAKARRYEELKAQMTAQLRVVLGARYCLLERETARIALELNLATARAQALAAQVSEKEQHAAGRQAAVFRLESELSEAQRRLAECRLMLERTRGRWQSQAGQVAAMEQRLIEAAAESQALQERTTQLEAELGRHQESAAELEVAVRATRERLEAKTAERDRLAAALHEQERFLESSREAVLRLMGEASRLRNQLAQLQEHLSAIERDTARAGKEQEAASSDLARLREAAREFSEKLGSRQRELELVRDQRRRLEADLAEARRQAALTRQERERLRTEFSQLKARRDSLEEILSHRAYTTDAVKRLFTAVERGQAGDFRPLGVLADFVEVDPSWEKAAEEFLHEELEYVVVDCWEQAERGLELVRELGEGRATFLVHAGSQAGVAEAGAAELEPGVSGRLADVLHCSNGLASSVLEGLPRLRQCRLIADREAAWGLAAAHPDRYYLLPDGACYHGHTLSGGKKSASGPLALKRELRELKVQVHAREQQWQAATMRLSELEQQIALWEQELERLRNAQQQLEKETVALDHERRKLSEEIERAQKRLTVARLEAERLTAERVAADRQRGAWEAELAAKESEREQLEQTTEQARRRLEQLRAEAAQCAEEHSGLRVELAGIEERRRAAATTLERLVHQARELDARRRALSAEMDRLGRERERLAQENRELEQRATELEHEIRVAEQQAESLAREEAQGREALTVIEADLRTLRSELATAQERRTQIELELVKRQAELRFLEETSRKELGVAAAELTVEEVTPDEEALAAAEQRYQELKSRLEALGPVNPQALEEYQQTQLRYDFLNAQRQDLLDSIRDTEQAIREIDAETRKRFQEAFQAINAHFQETFRALFGGGSAEMRLTDPENLAESGVDIIASPPGKRLQNVLLLSGGEKALAALALLLAMLKHQPSPFCVLDEVDAPLDDPNIERLMRLLEQMSLQTQFILITHTKRTMESAQVLYGVTMQEPGVSKLVSVRFQTPPPAPAVMETAARA